MIEKLTQLRNAYQQVAATSTESMLRQPHRSVKAHLQAITDFTDASVSSDVYGSGSLIEEFEQEIAALFGKEAACFMPSGTLAQNIVLKINAQASGKNKFACHPTSHLVLHEQAAFEHLWNLDVKLVGEDHAPLELADLGSSDLYSISTVVTELPAREIGGQLPTWEDLVAQSEYLKAQGIQFHFDGARIWQCKAAYGKSFCEIGALADSIYVSFYKDLAGISGAMLLGTKDLIEKAKVWQRRAGGNLFALHPYILSAKLGLKENLQAVDEAVEYAKLLGAALESIPSIELLPQVPQAAMFHFTLKMDEAELLKKMEAHCRTTGVQVLPLPRDKYVTHNQQTTLIFEIPVGRAAMSQPVSFWAKHLEALINTAV